MSTSDRNIPTVIENSLLKRGTSGILDLSKLETVEVVEPLNYLIANYTVHYQKLRNFHWNVTGSDFFDLHEQFEKQYTYVAEAIDVLAERIRVHGQKPISTMRECLKEAEINEVGTDLAPLEMVTEVVKDYEVLLRFTHMAITQAQKHGDHATEMELKQHVAYIEKNHWMFAAFVTGK